MSNIISASPAILIAFCWRHRTRFTPRYRVVVRAKASEPVVDTFQQYANLPSHARVIPPPTLSQPIWTSLESRNTQLPTLIYHSPPNTALDHRVRNPRASRPNHRTARSSSVCCLSINLYGCPAMSTARLLSQVSRISARRWLFLHCTEYVGDCRGSADFRNISLTIVLERSTELMLL